MVKDTSSPVFVQILDKDYQVACPPDERKALLQAAEDLDERMRAIRSSGSVVGLDRIAVMAALNLCHELHQARAQQESNPETGVVLERIAKKLEQALGKD